MRSSRGACSSSRTRWACATWTSEGVWVLSRAAFLRRLLRRRLFLCGLRFRLRRRLGVGRLFLARLELEADLAVWILHQKRLELAALLRYEVGQQVGASRRPQLLHLLVLVRLVQDHSA